LYCKGAQFASQAALQLALEPYKSVLFASVFSSKLSPCLSPLHGLQYRDQTGKTPLSVEGRPGLGPPEEPEHMLDYGT